MRLTPLLLLLSSAPTWATTIWNTFAPGDFTNGLYLGPPVRWATPFTPSSSAPLANITGAWLKYSPTSGTFTVSLQTDAAGQPGSLLESWPLLPGNWDSVSDQTLLNRTLVSSLNPSLSSGQTYWVVFSGVTGGLATDELGWAQYTNAPPGGVWISDTSSSNHFTNMFPFNSRPALRVEGVDAPEPSTAILLFCGLSGIAVLRRRWRSASPFRRQ